MSKAATFCIFSFFLWCVVTGTIYNHRPSVTIRSSRFTPTFGDSYCLQQDLKQECKEFCLFAVKPLLDHIKHHDQWNTSHALGLNKTQEKLDRIEGQQETIESILRDSMPQDIEARLKRMENQQEDIISNDLETRRMLERIVSQDLGTKLNRMESQQTLWQQKIIEKLAEPQQIFEEQKRALEDQLKFLKGKLSSSQNSTGSTYIPRDFQQIGNEFFYIERKIKLNWFAASDTCRRMGGHLATILNEEERVAVAAEVNAPPNTGFWLDIHNMANKFEYTSSTTGVEAPYIKWGRNQPNIINEDCIAMDEGEMHDYNCASKLYFICQA